jgi:phosphoribosylformimino-5-aminoimidazole carboxamide ribotide isomerase
MTTTAVRPRIVGVIDLRHGQAVQARAGEREAYAPVASIVGREIRPGDALALAEFYARGLGLDDVYAADLDAITGHTWQEETIRNLAASVPRLWLDAAITTPEEAQRALALGASCVVVGLETLPSYAALQRICVSATPERVALSLDVREGITLTAHAEIQPGTPVSVVAARAAGIGVRTIIVIDLARVGVGRGCNLDTIVAVRKAAPGVALLAGGGVRDEGDLQQLVEAGCDGALVATALLSGTLHPSPRRR